MIFTLVPAPTATQREHNNMPALGTVLTVNVELGRADQTSRNNRLTNVKQENRVALRNSSAV